MADNHGDNSSKYIVYSCLCIGYSVFFYNRRAYTSLMPTLLHSLELQESQLGVISSSFAFSYGLSKFITGILSDKIPPRELFAAGLIGTGLCNVIFTKFRSGQALALVWFLNGLVQGLSFPPCSKILKELFRPDEIGKFWSFLTVGGNIISSICPLMTVYLTSRYNWKYAMIVPGSIAVGIAPVLLYVTTHYSSDPSIVKDNPLNGTIRQLNASWTKVIFHLLCSPFLWVLINGYFLASVLRNCVIDWAQLYLIQEKNQSSSTVVVAMSSLEIGGMIGSILSGVITDKWVLKHDPSMTSSPRMPIFAWLFAGFVICIHLLRTAVDEESSTLFIGFLLFGCGVTISGSVSIYGLVAMENGPPGFSGTSHAIVALGASVGTVIAGYPLAALGKAYGWHTVFLLIQILGAVNFLVHLLTSGLNRQMIDPLKLQ